MDDWRIERLPSGMYGLFAENGTRVGVHRSKDEAERHKIRLIRAARKRGRKNR